MKLLFTKTEEIKEFIPVNISLEFDNLKESLRVATRKYFYEAISKKQYEELSDKFHKDSLDDKQTELLEHARRVIVNFALAAYVPHIQVQISDAGIHIVSTENKKTAFPWQVQDVQRSYIRTAYDAIEEMLEFLEENKTEFPIWVQSEAYTEAHECLLWSAKEFNKYIFIHSSRFLFAQLKPTLMRIQRTRIFTVCPALFEKIAEELKNGKVKDKYLTVIEQAQSALAKLAFAEFLKIKTVSVDEDGVTITNTNNTQTINGKKEAPSNYFEQARNTYLEQGEAELNNLIYFLKKNRRQYPEFEAQYPEQQDNCTTHAHPQAHRYACPTCLAYRCVCRKTKKMFHL